MSRILLLTAAIILLAAIPLAAQPDCSLAMVVGTYAVRGQGTLLMLAPGATQPTPLPETYVGIMSVDYSGAMTGKVFGTIAGDPFETSSLEGTASVKSDCTAILNYKTRIGDQAFQSTWSYVVYDDGDSLTGVANENFVVESTKWRRISKVPLERMRMYSPCTQGMFRGTYAMLYEGSALMTLPGATQPALIPYVQGGTVWIDRSGAIFGNYSVNMGGTYSEASNTNPANTVVMGTDCTGTITLVRDGGAVVGRFVMLDGGREAWSVAVQSYPPGTKPIGGATWRQISVQPPR